MGILAWMIVGIIWMAVGLITGALAKRDYPSKIIMNMILGILGAFIGGFLGFRYGGFIQSVIVAALGAIILLVIYRMVIWRQNSPSTAK